MKYFGVFIAAFILGYLLYQKMNPPLETVIYRTEKQTTLTPIETRALRFTRHYPLFEDFIASTGETGSSRR